jgi:L,D-transpeptidase ErfK/SrfK
VALAAVALLGASSGGPLARGRLTGTVQEYRVAPRDTLRTIGARFGVDARTLAFDNGLTTGAALAAGRVLRVDNRHLAPALEPDTIVINIPQRMLFFDDGDRVVALPAAVGRRDWATPIGSFTVVAKEVDPTWHVPPSIQEEAAREGRPFPATVPPGPGNPLGRYWLGLSFPGIGIHSTNAPSSIYSVATHGCVRLHPDDAGWLYARVAAGTRGEMVYQPVLLAVVAGDIYLEAHGDVYRRAGDFEPYVRAQARAAGLESEIDWSAAAAVLQAQHGVARFVGAIP